MLKESTLDCQTCGCFIRQLSKEEAAKVSANPYNFIVYCSNRCMKDDTYSF